MTLEDLLAREAIRDTLAGFQDELSVVKQRNVTKG